MNSDNQKLVLQGATKETAELLTPMAKVVDSVFQSTAGGQKFDFREHYPNFIDDLLTLQPAIQGADQVDEEALTQTPEDRQNIRAVLKGQMPNVPETQKELYVDSIMGVHAITSLFWRRGFNAGQDHIIQGKTAIKV